MVVQHKRGTMWRRAWVNSLDQFELRSFETWYPEHLRLIQNIGRGLITQATNEWTDYEVSTSITPHLCAAFGIVARVQGLRRGYALIMRRNGQAQLVKLLDQEVVLAETSFTWVFDQSLTLALRVQGEQVSAFVDGQPLLTVRDDDQPLLTGGIGLLCETGRADAADVVIIPVGKE